ncbi:MAG: DNA repair protein RecO C-terminal domain-containing protein [Bacteroidales bacterium]|nr:DNA repair protein RecO C-terminal domain-containing protein [Bacteroidales bacterium]
MNTIKTPVIVLNAFRYGDDKLIAECLSRSEGRVSFAVRISHSKRAAVRHTLFRPMAVLEVEWTERARGGLLTPRSATTFLPFSSLHTDPMKQTVLLFLAEMLLHIVRGEQVETTLFDFTTHSLEWFDMAENGYANFHIVFLMRLSLFLGITPSVEEAQQPYFDLMAGEFVAIPPAHPHFIAKQEAEAFGQLMRMNFATMHLFKLSREERSRILHLIVQYYRLHLPSMPELKSLEILSSLFN